MTKPEKFKNVKYYAKKYGISVLENGRPKTVTELTVDIYQYERKNPVTNGMYPFLKIKK
jgi:hypothetical protein